MRNFIDAILAVISAASMNDDEFGMITIEVQAYTKELHDEIMVVLDSREAVSNTRDRLTLYFRARGVDVGTPAPVGSSKIFLGDGLCS